MKRFLIALILVLPILALAAPTTLTVVQVSETAAAIADNAADTANGNRVSNPNGDVFFILRNTSGSDSATVTFTAQTTSKQVPGFGPMTKSNLAVSLAANAIKHVGPFPKAAWNDSSNYIQLATTGTASSSVKITPLRVLRP